MVVLNHSPWEKKIISFSFSSQPVLDINTHWSTWTIIRKYSTQSFYVASDDIQAEKDKVKWWALDKAVSLSVAQSWPNGSQIADKYFIGLTI